MLVTALVSQSPIGPYVVVAVVGLVTHVVTAVAILEAVRVLAHVPEDQDGYAAWSVGPHLL